MGINGADDLKGTREYNLAELLTMSPMASVAAEKPAIIAEPTEPVAYSEHGGHDDHGEHGDEEAEYLAELTPEEQHKRRRNFIFFVIGLLLFSMMAFNMWNNQHRVINVALTDETYSSKPAKPAPTPTPTPQGTGAPATPELAAGHWTAGYRGANGANGATAPRQSRTITNVFNYYPAQSATPAPTPGMGNSGDVLGEETSSSNYLINESMVGGSADIAGAASTNYVDGGSTAGDIAVGRSTSPNYRTESGFNTTDDPRLELTVDTESVYLGHLDLLEPAKGQATFSVLAYNASGYVVQIFGNSLHDGPNYINNLTTDTASSPGTEQFGINLVANTAPSVGADPVQIPDSTFSFGEAGDGFTGAYATTNLFRYNSGETIASSGRDSGETGYTISFMCNISTGTTGNVFSTELVLVAVGTF